MDVEKATKPSAQQGLPRSASALVEAVESKLATLTALHGEPARVVQQLKKTVVVLALPRPLMSASPQLATSIGKIPVGIGQVALIRVVAPVVLLDRRLVLYLQREALLARVVAVVQENQVANEPTVNRRMDFTRV